MRACALWFWLWFWLCVCAASEAGTEGEGQRHACPQLPFSHRSTSPHSPHSWFVQDRQHCEWRVNLTTTRDYKALSMQYFKTKWRWGKLLNTKHLTVQCGYREDGEGYLSMMARLVSSLHRDKGVQSLVFFGDSVMEQQFLFMEITMKALKKKTNNILAAHFVSSVGTTGDEKALEQLQALFQVAKGPSSVIIANYGLHFQHLFGTTGRPALLNAVSALLLNLESISLKSRPRLLWREGTPLQYSSSANGWWSPIARTCPARCCPCIALTPEIRVGNITSDTENASAWDVFPSHAMDDVVFPLLQHHRVPICRVYDALAVRDDLHAGLLPPDCTHFGPDALLYMNAQVLKSLVSNLEPS